MPCRVRKEVRLEPPQGPELEKNENYRYKGGGVICAPSQKHRIAPNFADRKTHSYHGFINEKESNCLSFYST